MDVKKIAILGATSHIAKGLIYNFQRSSEDKLYLFARSPSRVSEFLHSIKCDRDYPVEDINDFGKGSYDVVINCVGVRNSAERKQMGYEIFCLMEEFDNVILKYLLKHQDSLYINFSSGAVYGDGFSSPVDENTTVSVNVNDVRPENYYAIARRNSEAKHRALSHLNIVDLRIFSYFSRFIDLNTKFLLSEIVNAVLDKRTFVTSSSEITRDFIHPKDLFDVVKKIVFLGTINDSFDMYSVAPVKKSEILEFFEENYNLDVERKNDFICNNATGDKSEYFSLSKKTECISYCPEHTSMEAISLEFEHII